ncbi:MAG: D-aminoacyl-tRNA deacylase [Chitinophagales bacterium]|nr:D-tyrosyl-tRNA(Tyr) deacylase [Chitinophagales bacterium]
MRVVIQKVSKASVAVNKQIVGKIEKGLLVLVGFEDANNQEDIVWMCNKIVNMRIFNDDEGKMNLSIKDVNGDILLVSQFTLHALTKKGNRPSFIKAAKPDIAIPLYQKTILELENLLQKPIATGIFGAMMDVQLNNDGPVTIIMDSKLKEVL